MPKLTVGEQTDFLSAPGVLMRVAVVRVAVKDATAALIGADLDRKSVV